MNRLQRFGLWLCSPKIVLPNPLWWIVGYGAIYPWRRAKRLYRKVVPLPPIVRHCKECGMDIGDSLWGCYFCCPIRSGSEVRERVGVALEDSIPIPDDPDGHHTVKVLLDSGRG